MYQVEFSEQAIKEISLIRKSDLQVFRKLEKLIPKLQEHPYTGTGHPHQLRHIPGMWSRKIDKKNRIRYMVNDSTIIVFVVSALGHYDDK